MHARILLADDHEIVLEGIRNLLAKSGRDWKIVGEARNGQEAVAMVKNLRPDVAILDITMPVMSGLEAAKQIADVDSDCRILMFTMHESERLGIEARNSGAHGYVLKAQAARDLIRAIDYLLRDETFFGEPPEPERNPRDKQNPGPIFMMGMAPAFAW
jgi:DNA-binding NarL/FixJ family response regulator